MILVKITVSLIGILLLSSVGFVYLAPEQTTEMVVELKRADAAKYLPRSYRVIIPDHIGFGESDRPDSADVWQKS